VTCAESSAPASLGPGSYLWNCILLRYVDCHNKKFHVGWRWPEDAGWTWCNDRYRKKDPKRLPTERRPTVAPTPPPPAVLPPAPPPATFSKNWCAILKDAHTYMDYGVQETLATVSSTFTADVIQFRFKELPFQQGDFGWNYKRKVNKKKKEDIITCICTFVASTAAAEFYKSPQSCISRWGEDGLWHDCMRVGSDLHQCYVRSCLLTNQSVMNALGLEAFHCTPTEYLPHLDRLLEKHTDFSDLRDLFAQRSLRTLTDVCPNCHGTDNVVTMLGDTMCRACNVQITQVPVNIQTCFAATSREAEARSGQVCAFVVILGPRAFFIGVKAPDYLAMDSHHRTFRGNFKDSTSICIKGRF